MMRYSKYRNINRRALDKRVTLMCSCVLVFAVMFQNLQAQQLQNYIESIIANNPEIKAFTLRHAIAEEQVEASDWIPNTEIGIGYFVSEPETRTGPQVAKFSFRQLLPWFGTLSQRKNYAASLAEAEFIRITVAKRKLALSVSQSYYHLSTNVSKRKVLDEQIKVLETYETLLLNGIVVDKASTVDMLKLQIRKNQLEQEKSILEEEYKAGLSHFNMLLHTDKDADLTLEPLYMPEQDMQFDESALEANAELMVYDRLYESIQELELLNQKEKQPMIGIGMDYIPVSERLEANISDNGKDIIMPTVSLSIPIFNKKHGATTRQNALRQEEIQAEKQQQIETLHLTYTKALSRRNKARIAYTSQVKNIEQAKNAEDIVLQQYETGIASFKEVLELQEVQLNFQLQKLEAIAVYYNQSAILKYLTTTLY